MLNEVLDNFLAIVPESVIKPLTYQLKRRLRTVGVLLWHVEIVNKANSLELGILWLIFIVCSSVEVALDHLLCSIGACSGREVNGERKFKLVELSQESFFNQDSLTDT